jgi:hypothetical protein
MRHILASSLSVLLLVLGAGCGGSSSSTDDTEDAAGEGDGSSGGTGARRGGSGPSSGAGSDAAVPDGAPAADGPAAVDTGAPDARAVDGPVADAASPPDTATPDTAPPKPDAQTPDSAPDPCAGGGTCDQIAKEYQAALERAKVCTLILTNQCEQKAPDTLTCQACTVWVNSTTELDQIRTKFNQQGCNKCLRPCPAIIRLCRTLTQGTCTSSTAIVASTDPIIKPAPMLRTGTCAEKGTVATSP